ncbi:MAG: DNA-binding protein WhiA [Clostridia bacterium]|nr:DNA-binding protein WhiA [Clostridia bacterium]
MTGSYAKAAKEALLEVTEKRKKCCNRILTDMLSLNSIDDSEERINVLIASSQHFKCASCFPHFLKGLFISSGNVTNPEKAYHLELSFKTEVERDCAMGILEDNGLPMKRTKRKNRFLLYIKDSTQIEDFFAVIGANRLAFDLMNSKIIREMRGDANRQMNCDMANIKKTLKAAGRHVELIGEMMEKGTIIRLPNDLRETARLRYENTQASMTDLGLLHNPPISKSGVKHRLDKIVDFYEEINHKE